MDPKDKKSDMPLPEPFAWYMHDGLSRGFRDSPPQWVSAGPAENPWKHLYSEAQLRERDAQWQSLLDAAIAAERERCAQAIVSKLLEQAGEAHEARDYALRERLKDAAGLVFTATRKDMTFPGVFIINGDPAEAIDHMNKVTADWTMRAARGECSWVCSDCCVTFPDGMPDACEHGHQSCTAIIKRDKADAAIDASRKEPT